MNHLSPRRALPLLAVLIIMLLAVPSMALANGGEWTWMSGANTANQAGVYGSLGVPAPGNVPGARDRSISWIDSAGNLWLLGGIGLDGAGNLGVLNDLWRYDANGEWTWVSGANTVNQAGVHGVQGTPDPTNVPGARQGSISWIDAADNLWLFGGRGRDGAGNNGYLNDLWRYDVAGGQWTWMSGADTIEQAGVYGAQGMPDPANVPGARVHSISWIDGGGNLWLLGGYGRDGQGDWEYLNDLWRYDANGEWTWMSGAATGFQAGVYGVQGTPDPANVPGTRTESISWIDGAGNLWLFGGEGHDSAGFLGMLNDLWRYDANGEWTWMSGASTVDQGGVYGVLGAPAPGNVPGARYNSISWIDGHGNLWLFGGFGYVNTGSGGLLNDLWRYDTNGEWTWMSGADIADQAGVYGLQGTPHPTNVPGARLSSISWIDGDGKLWLLGGFGYDGAGIGGGVLNDLWRFSFQIPAAAIEMVKTVGTDPDVCATESDITVPAGTEVYYCYTVTNTGDETLNYHDLVDDQLGTIFSGLNYALAPGDSVNTVAVGLTIPAVMNTTTTNVATWMAYNGANGMSGHVKSLAFGPDGSLYAGGEFTAAGGVTANRIARWDGTQWHPLDSGMNDIVFALAVGLDGSLYAGGDFITADGVAANRIAHWDGTQWHPLGSGMSDVVFTLVVGPDGSLYAGGFFTTAGGVAVDHIARWDGVQWYPLGGGTSFMVAAQVSGSDGSLYTGGDFMWAGGVSANNIARWDGAQWHPLGSGTDNPVGCLVFGPNGSLYAGGFFTTAGGAAANNIARWDGVQWHPLGSGMNNWVVAVAVGPDGSLYAGGEFTTADGVAANYIARWDGTQWHPLGSGMNNWVDALAFGPDGSLYAGGAFTTAGGVAANYIARWDGAQWHPLLDSDSSVTATAMATVAVADVGIVKTVGVDPGTCGPESNITVPAGTEVYYCYTVTNTGDVTLNLHDLDDDQLGNIFTGLNYALGPGESVDTVAAGLTIPAIITMPTLNTATWTAYNDGGPEVMAEASAFVDVIYFSCQNPVEDFANGVPAWGWTVVNNAPGGPVWGDIASCGPNGNGGNWTGGLGNAACISASTLTPGEYDAELRTPLFSLVGYSESAISFRLNYQNWAGIDRLTFDISADGGMTWAALRTYITDQGAFQNTPGVYVTTDLAGYLGQDNLMLRWRYHWDDPQALGWYAQVDEAEFKCVQIPPTAVTLAGLEAGGQVGMGWGWLLALAASGLALAGTLACRRNGQAGLR